MISDIMRQYNNTAADTINAHLKAAMSRHTAENIYIKTGIGTQTINAIRKKYSKYKPSFEIAIRLCDFLQVDITDIIKPITADAITDRQHKQHGNAGKKTKWTFERKQEFIRDYDTMDELSLANKYKIDIRTAREYYRKIKTEITKGE
jgi:DNA-binding XRE family transcriptional regulator